MIKREYEDYQRATLKKWQDKVYFLNEIYLNNIFNWRDATLKLNSPVSLITGKNGTGKSTFINALKQAYNLQNGDEECGILSLVQNYKIKLVNHQNNELVVENRKIVKKDFSLPILRDLTFNSSLYTYYKNSTGKDMSSYLKTLEQYDAKPLPGYLLSIMKELIGKQIISAEKIIDQEVIDQDAEQSIDGEIIKPERPNLEYYRLKLIDGTTYDSYTMGSGEFYINQFLWSLENLPGECIVLIEELENFLHSEAQKKILELIYKYSVKKNVQFILTTHSSTLIDHANTPSRILIKMDSKSNIMSVNDCSNWLAKDVLGIDTEDKIEVLVEDEKAKQLFKSIISQKNPNMLKQLIINNVGGDSIIKKCIEINEKLESSKVVGIIDGDSSIGEQDYLLKFPGEEPPEKFMMAYITDSYEKVAEKIYKTTDDVKTAFENAKTLSDYHEWFSNAASNLGEDNNVLWGDLTRMWCRDNIEKIDVFCAKFEDQFNKLKN